VVWQPQETPSRLKAAVEEWAQKKGTILQHRTGGGSPISTPFLGPDNDVLILALPVKFSQTPSEVVSLSDVQSLVELVVLLSQKGVER
jgi:hypothetical protein